MKLFLIRHGQSTANLEQVYAGQTDVKLTEQGRQEAAAIAPILQQIPFDKVFSSDLSRALDTQKLALPQAQATVTPLLREFSVGSLEGMSFAKVRELYGTQLAAGRDYTPFGGENDSMVRQRLTQFLAQLESDPCENVAAFVHNGLITCMMRHILGGEFDRTAIRSGNCAIHVFHYDGAKWRLLAWNYMGKI